VSLTSPVVAAATNGGAAPASSGVSAFTGGAEPGALPAETKKVHKTVTKARMPAKATGGAAPKAKAKAKAPAKAKPPAPSTTGVAGRFPVTGSDWSMDGADLRFGAPRSGHTHQGQDILAPEGTPIVAPLAGTVTWSANQPAGAGIYVVIRGSDGRDYVFMHIRPKTLLVAPDDTVAVGEQIAQVGHTGDAEGPHLHFEIWVGGWYEKGGAPIDPLPDLQRWAGLR
jgi:murein DD-endopeptidase MepM/ murein hydrolase activator NlpD